MVYGVGRAHYLSLLLCPLPDPMRHAWFMEWVEHITMEGNIENIHSAAKFKLENLQLKLKELHCIHFSFADSPKNTPISHLFISCEEDHTWR